MQTTTTTENTRWYHSSLAWSAIFVQIPFFAFLGLYFTAVYEYNTHNKAAKLTHPYNCTVVNFTYNECEYCSSVGQNGCNSYNDGWDLVDILISHSISSNYTICDGQLWFKEQFSCSKKQKSSNFEIGKLLFYIFEVNLYWIFTIVLQLSFLE